MKIKFLFPNSFKIIGWVILLQTIICGSISLLFDFGPEILNTTVLAVFVDEVFGSAKAFRFIENNLLDEILGVLLIISSILVAFSKEKDEDEFISKIRLESLVWSTYVNYAVLLIAFVFV